jgi:hypothetical protein
MAKNDSSQYTNSTVNAAASTNSTLVKGAAGQIKQLFAFNASAATKYIRLYDKATAPTVGTDAPVIVIAVPATSSKELIFGDNTGLPFKTGIGLAITGGAARLDATAVAAGDVQLYVNAV